MSYKTHFAAGGFLAILVLATFSSVLFTPTRDASASPLANVIGAATTSTAFAVTSSTRVLATTTSTSYPSYTRVYATICNPNANPVYVNLDNDRRANASNVTVVIAAAAGYDACYEITDRNAYQGSITASSTNETSTTISVKDYVTL